MNEIRRHGRELIDQARRERTPDAAARERVFGALMASAALTSAAGASTAPVAAKQLTGFSKWLVLAGLAGTMTGALYLARHVGVTPQPVPFVAASAAGPVAPAVRPAQVAAATSAATEFLPTPAVHDLEAEPSGLHAAHAAYRVGNAALALELIAEHKARFPKSQLGTERATLEVLSLCLAGRTREARGLAGRLRKSASSAAALSGLDGSCAGQ